MDMPPASSSPAAASAVDDEAAADAANDEAAAPGSLCALLSDAAVLGRLLARWPACGLRLGVALLARVALLAVPAKYVALRGMDPGVGVALLRGVEYGWLAAICRTPSPACFSSRCGVGVALLRGVEHGWLAICRTPAQRAFRAEGSLIFTETKLSC